MNEGEANVLKKDDIDLLDQTYFGDEKALRGKKKAAFNAKKKQNQSWRPSITLLTNAVGASMIHHLPDVNRDLVWLKTQEFRSKFEEMSKQEPDKEEFTNRVLQNCRMLSEVAPSGLLTQQVYDDVWKFVTSTRPADLDFTRENLEQRNRVASWRAAGLSDLVNLLSIGANMELETFNVDLYISVVEVMFGESSDSHFLADIMGASLTMQQSVAKHYTAITTELNRIVRQVNQTSVDGNVSGVMSNFCRRALANAAVDYRSSDVALVIESKLIPTILSTIIRDDQSQECTVTQRLAWPRVS